MSVPTTPIARVMCEKLDKMPERRSELILRIARACDCSEAAVHAWINGRSRPSSKYLDGISGVLRIHRSRLVTARSQTPMLRSGVVSLGTTVNSDAPKVEVVKAKKPKPDVCTFTPSIDDISVAVQLAKLPEDRQRVVLDIATVLRENL